MTRAIAKKDETEMAVPGFDFSADVGKGMEGADRESFAIPFLTVLQKISPQVDEAEAEYVEGAKAGMFLNTVTKKLYAGDTGLLLIPVAFQRRFIRWAPRGSGGGFKGELMPEQVAKMEADGELIRVENRLYVPAENGSVDPKKCDLVSDTRNHFCITELGEQVLISLTSTQIKKSRGLMSALDMVRVNGKKVPTFLNLVRATIRQESNEQGTWYGWQLNLEGFVQSEETYKAARDFHDAVTAGEVVVDMAKAQNAPAEEGTDF